MLGEIGQKFSELDLSSYEKVEGLSDIKEDEDNVLKGTPNVSSKSLNSAVTRRYEIPLKSHQDMFMVLRGKVYIEPIKQECKD